jgi:hypothetical protein
MNIHIRTIHQLFKLTSKITAEPRFASLIARYTKGVLVDHSIDNFLSLQREDGCGLNLRATRSSAGLFAILRVVKHLDTLVCRTLDVSKALSSIIAPASCPISTGLFLLQVLEIQVQNLGPSLLRQLGQFVALQHLGLFIPNPFDVLDAVSVGDDLVEHTPAWSMPLLHSIWWHSDKSIHKPDAAFFDFLARSSFPALRALNLSLFPLSASARNAASRFFANHAHLQSVELDSKRWGLADLVPLVASPQLLIDTVDAGCISASNENFTTRFNRELKELILLAHHGSDEVLKFVYAIEEIIQEQPWIESIVVRFQPGSARDSRLGLGLDSPNDGGHADVKEQLAVIIETWTARNITTKLRDEILADPPVSGV